MAPSSALQRAKISGRPGNGAAQGLSPAWLPLQVQNILRIPNA
jgi:hypothetical protein